jgi:hypothetical protein
MPMRARGFASILILLLLSPPLWGYPLSRTIEMSATGYAPLDPQAVRGMCFFMETLTSQHPGEGRNRG